MITDLQMNKGDYTFAVDEIRSLQKFRRGGTWSVKITFRSGDSITKFFNDVNQRDAIHDQIAGLWSQSKKLLNLDLGPPKKPRNEFSGL